MKLHKRITQRIGQYPRAIANKYRRAKRRPSIFTQVLGALIIFELLRYAIYAMPLVLT